MDLLSALGLVSTLISTCILAPISLFTLIRFYQLRYTETLKHRQKVLVYYMNTLSILGLLFQWVSMCKNVWQLRMGSALTYTIYIIDGTFLWLVFALFCIKTWLLLYEKQYHSSNASQTWKLQINSRYTSWYVSNKHKYGNFKFIFWRICLVPLLCCVVLESVFEFTVLLSYNIHSMLILSVIFIVPSLFVHIIKFKGFSDIFGIKKEIFYQIIGMLAIMAIHLVQLLCTLKYAMQKRLDWLITLSIASLTLFLLSFISTVYPIYLHSKFVNERALSNAMSVHSHSQMHMTKHTNTVTNMLSVIAHKKGFTLFMSHLINEFATENLLFVLELIQIKSEYTMSTENSTVLPSSPMSFMRQWSTNSPKRSTILTNFNLTNMSRLCNDVIENVVTSADLVNNDKQVWGTVIFPLGLPRSELLNVNKKIKDQLYALYCKYVRDDSTYPINISYFEKSKIDKYFDQNYTEIVNEAHLKNGSHKMGTFQRHISSKHSIAQNLKAIELLGLGAPKPKNKPKIADKIAVNSNTMSRAINAPPNTPKPANKHNQNISFAVQKMCENTPRTPSLSVSRSNSNTYTKSKAVKMKEMNITVPTKSKSIIKALTPSVGSKRSRLKNTLSTPILDYKNVFPEITLNEHFRSSSAPPSKIMKAGSHSQSTNVKDSFNRSYSSLRVAEEDIPEDFMVIIDYNMNEQSKEEEFEGSVGEFIDEEKEREEMCEIEIDLKDESEESEMEENGGNESEKDIHELYTIMDGAGIEVLQLMYHSYLRFTKTEKGQQIYQALIIGNEQ